MGLDSALQRVNELRMMTNPSGGSAPASTQTSAAADGAFTQALAQQQAAMAFSGTSDPAAAGASGTLTMSEYGIPIVTVEDQYRALGVPMPSTPGIGIQGMAGMYGGGDVGERMVALAKQELGVREETSNESPRIREYRTATAGAENTPGPWCAYFVSWLAKQSGAPIGAGGHGTGYVPTLEAWGKQENRYVEFGQQQPKPGDIVIFNWDGNGISDHTGIVEYVEPNGTIHTIEGNSSNKVQRREYAVNTNDIKGYVRPG